jgi:O-antigen/teichoic acid export membrane protein
MKLKLIFSKSAPLLIGNIIVALGTLISVPLLLEYYGVSNYGYFASFIVLINLINTIINLQPWQSMIQYWYSTDSDDIRSCLSKLCIVIDFFSAFIAALFFLVFYGYMLDFLNINVFFSFKVIGAAFLYILTYQTSFPISVFKIQSRYILQAFLDCLESLSKFALAIYVYCSGKTVSLQDFVSLYFCFGVFCNLLRFTLAVYYSKESLRYSLSIHDIKESMPFVKYSFWVYIKSILDLPLTHLDRLIVIKFLGPSSAATLDVLKKVLGLISFSIRPLSEVLLPEMTSYVKSGNSKLALKFSIKNSVLLLISCFSVITIGFLIFGYTNILSYLGLELIMKDIKMSYFYIIIGSISMSFVFVHILFMAEGLVSKDAVNLLIANVVYLSILLLAINVLELGSIVLAMLIQSIFVITYKLLMLKRRC